MPEAFVLVKTEPSHERDVYLELTSHVAVKEVHALYGEFDLLAHVSSESAKTLTTPVSYTHLTLPTKEEV